MWGEVGVLLAGVAKVCGHGGWEARPWGRGCALEGDIGTGAVSLGFWVTIGEHSLPPTPYHHVLSHHKPKVNGINGLQTKPSETN